MCADGKIKIKISRTAPLDSAHNTVAINDITDAGHLGAMGAGGITKYFVTPRYQYIDEQGAVLVTNSRSHFPCDAGPDPKRFATIDYTVGAADKPGATAVAKLVTNEKDGNGTMAAWDYQQRTNKGESILYSLQADGAMTPAAKLRPIKKFYKFQHGSVGYFPATGDGRFANEWTLKYKTGCLINDKNEALAFTQHWVEGTCRPEPTSFTLASGVDMVPVLALLNEYESLCTTHMHM